VIYRSYVFREPEASCTLETLVSRIGSFLAANSGRLGDVYSYQGIDENTNSHVWRQKSKGGSEVRLEGGNVPNGRYLVAGASTSAACERVAAVFADEFSFWTVAELVSKARSCPKTEPIWIELMTLATNTQPNSDVRSVIDAQLRSTSAKCRRAAVMGAGLVRWPELLPALASMLKSESDAGTREILRFVIEQIQHEAEASRSGESKKT